MSLVFEDPPEQEGRGAHLSGVVRERSPLRKEIDNLLGELSQYPQRWARLFDFNDKEEADKRATQVRTAAGKGWNVATRRLDDGRWSVFARMRSAEEQQEADLKRAQRKAQQASQGFPEGPQVEGQAPAQEMPTPTFQ
jgi:hypothetical protein